jgi:hypothetical protein
VPRRHRVQGLHRHELRELYLQAERALDVDLHVRGRGLPEQLRRLLQLTPSSALIGGGAGLRPPSSLSHRWKLHWDMYVPSWSIHIAFPSNVVPSSAMGAPSLGVDSQ